MAAKAPSSSVRSFLERKKKEQRRYSEFPEQLVEVGVKGRKTGYVVKSIIARDADDLENVDDFFESSEEEEDFEILPNIEQNDEDSETLPVESPSGEVTVTESQEMEQTQKLQDRNEFEPSEIPELILEPPEHGDYEFEQDQEEDRGIIEKNELEQSIETNVSEIGHMDYDDEMDDRELPDQSDDDEPLHSARFSKKKKSVSIESPPSYDAVSPSPMSVRTSMSAASPIRSMASTPRSILKKTTPVKRRSRPEEMEQYDMDDEEEEEEDDFTPSGAEDNDVEEYETPRREPEPVRTKVVPEEFEEPNPALIDLRRSARKRMKPLQYWKNERPVYKIDDRIGFLSVEGIVKPKSPAVQRKRHPDVPSDEEDQFEIPLKKDGKEMKHCIGKKRSSVENPKKGDMKSKVTVAEAFKEPEFSSGVMTIPPNATQSHLTKKILVFYVASGKIHVLLDECEFTMGSGAHFFIPRNHRYTLENPSWRTCRLVFFRT